MSPSPGSGHESFDAMWAALEPIGRNRGSGGYRRFAWTGEDHELREWFAGECTARGLDLVEDRAGNQWGWWGDPDAEPGTAVVSGSHLDSVPDGGAFDGPLGVVSTLAAIDELRRRDVVPGRPLAVVNFVEEEGARFGVACAGSRLLTGALPADPFLARRDADGISAAEALTRAGRRAERTGADPEAMRRIGCFLELHVEQGRGLAEYQQPVALGTGVWPHGRWRVDFPGEANHAGTTGMGDRRDAMLGFAELVLAARAVAVERGCLATVGKVQVRPNGVNAVPGAVTGWLDARAADEATVRSAVGAITARLVGHEAAVTEESWTPATVFATDLVDRLRRTLPEAPLLSTGAGHDAGILVQADVPAAMLFIRNPTGVSHSPAEWAAPADCRAGVEALTAALAGLLE